MTERQAIMVQVVNESSVLSRMQSEGWTLTNKSDWNADRTQYIAHFERDEDRGRTPLNG